MESNILVLYKKNLVSDDIWFVDCDKFNLVNLTKLLELVKQANVIYSGGFSCSPDWLRAVSYKYIHEVILPYDFFTDNYISGIIKKNLIDLLDKDFFNYLVLNWENSKLYLSHKDEFDLAISIIKKELFASLK